MIQKQPTTSFVSGNGASVTFDFPPLKVTRAEGNAYQVELWSGREPPVVALTGLDASPTMKSVVCVSRCVVKRVVGDVDEFPIARSESERDPFLVARH